jgi:putative PIN family toxin of toxin-antitoxin system
MNARIVIDTDVYISRALRHTSVPAKAVDTAWLEATTLLSAPTWHELRIVLQRKKFERYIDPETLGAFLRTVWLYAEQVSIPTPIRACRDPRADKFLEVAVHGRADLILTGDADLLALHPYEGIAILAPAEFLQTH